MGILLTLALVYCLIQCALGATYHQVDNILGGGFYNAFSFEAIEDPTHGRVNYVNAATARTQNLTFATTDTFILRSDYRTHLFHGGPGRNSVRLISNKQYTTSVQIFNIRHMPQGCGTWPAVWTVGANWPNQGEIDILEGVNDQGPNHATLHTNEGCTMPASRSQTGSPTSNNCDVAATNNAGCGVKMNDPRSYGPAFNVNGGGWFAVERTDRFIKVWFWPRGAANLPADVALGATHVKPETWGTPTAKFPNTMCNIASKFGRHNIVINLTFCGDWAGNYHVYESSGCPSTCVDYVNNNPNAFLNAYFDFAWIKVYELPETPHRAAANPLLRFQHFLDKHHIVFPS